MYYNRRQERNRCLNVGKAIAHAGSVKPNNNQAAKMNLHIYIYLTFICVLR